MHRLHLISLTCLVASVLFAGIGGIDIEHNTPETTTSTPTTKTTSPALTPAEKEAADAKAMKEAEAAAYKRLVDESRKVKAAPASRYADPVKDTEAPAEEDHRVTYLTGMVVVLIVLLAIAVAFAMRRPAM